MADPLPSGEGARGIIAFIGIGSNLEDPTAQCREAFRRLDSIPGIRVLRRSSLYRTAPVGPENQPFFINAVAEIRTDLPPRKLFEALKEIEGKMGRSEGPRWGPRVIDLDILLYGQQVVVEEGLIIPHPEMHRRRFVLEPLGELASYMVHPGFGISIRGLLDRMTDSGLVERCPAEIKANERYTEMREI
jgi:2-amino-4-hydroxy-6-hydroxymethyldihydropteridine diphosphokinase